MPGRDPGGIIVTILIGIAGSFVGTMIGRALGLYRQGQGCGIHHVAAGLELKFRQLSALVSEDSAFMASVGARSGMRLTDVLERQLHLVERSPRIVTMREPNGSQLVLRVGGEALQVVVGLRVDDPRAINCAADRRPARRARVHEEATQALLGEPVENLFLADAYCAALGFENARPEFERPVWSSVPTLFITGSLDSNTPAMNAEEVRRGLPHSAHLEVELGGHETLPCRRCTPLASRPLGTSLHTSHWSGFSTRCRRQRPFGVAAPSSSTSRHLMVPARSILCALLFAGRGCSRRRCS